MDDPRYYKLIDSGVVEVPFEEWAPWFEGSMDARTVGLTTLDYRGESILVTTVFFGIAGGPAPPLMFETLVQGGQEDGLSRRWPTPEEARAGHDRVVAEVRAMIARNFA